MTEPQQDLRDLEGLKDSEGLKALKAELEKPGVGSYRHNLAKRLEGRTDVSLEQIQEWLDTEWYVMGHRYLWLAAMYACIGRPDVPPDILYKGLCKPDPHTFNAAIEACRGRKLPIEVISKWYKSPSIILQLAAVNAYRGSLLVPEWIKQASHNHDIRIQKIANQILTGP